MEQVLDLDKENNPTSCSQFFGGAIMGEAVAPCMDRTVDIDTLVKELEDHCPLQLNL